MKKTRKVLFNCHLSAPEELECFPVSDEDSKCDDSDAESESDSTCCGSGVESESKDDSGGSEPESPLFSTENHDDIFDSRYDDAGRSVFFHGRNRGGKRATLGKW